MPLKVECGQKVCKFNVDYACTAEEISISEFGDCNTADDRDDDDD